MPLDATPTPPPTGIYGSPLVPYGNDYSEPLKQQDGGGYIIWKLEDVNGKQRWMPTKHVPPETVV